MCCNFITTVQQLQMILKDIPTGLEFWLQKLMEILWNDILCYIRYKTQRTKIDIMSMYYSSVRLACWTLCNVLFFNLSCTFTWLFVIIHLFHCQMRLLVSFTWLPSMCVYFPFMWAYQAFYNIYSLFVKRNLHVWVWIGVYFSGGGHLQPCGQVIFNL